MSLQRIILEMGTGNDLYGEDYTKAAIRAVQDALHHSSITLFRSMDFDRDEMQVEVTIGTQKPDLVNTDEVAAQIPFGSVKVNTIKGGLNIEDHVQETVTVIATAAIAARIDIPEGKYSLV
ncbi:Lin0512 family protein [uncultured Cocleimonas sp.]|uniref:Lin0512 family protein n=1 Tax=uncultured Cocleimonas sp. TaxID=1051587 RepID=UPI00262BC43E|nr:Lin0512 family protein [uncultured Cocleimonas sp.]